MHSGQRGVIHGPRIVHVHLRVPVRVEKGNNNNADLSHGINLRFLPSYYLLSLTDDDTKRVVTETRVVGLLHWVCWCVRVSVCLVYQVLLWFMQA